jgi:predicted phosphodiesterase
MRLGLLGPAGAEVGALGRAAEFLLNGARVHRAIYLGNDGALDRAVAAWARKLVGDDPSDAGAWTRAAEIALHGTPTEIDRFVATERARLRLKALEALPSQAGSASVSRTIEMVGDRVAVLIYDKAQLDDEDILAANILLFGKSHAPLVDQLDTRWFVTPGPIGVPGGGLAVLDDEQDEVSVTLYDSTGKVTRREALTAPRDAREQGAT